IIAVSLFSSFDKSLHVHAFTMLELESFKLDAGFKLDSLSLWMTMIITGVGSLIHIFSIGYMHGDKGFYKFFTYLNLFIFSMLVLVLGDNYMMLFFGWEGVGICSFLLIGFHYADKVKGIENSIAARKAFIMNRIGDLGLLVACFLLLGKFGTLNYDEIGLSVILGEFQNDSVFMVSVTLSLFLAATGKSAQIPLFTWLPDAMAGPTPVSALIHAATMVTAGIYLTIRSNFLFELAPFTQHIILFIGMATALVAAFIAMKQNDIKKVLAYSTVSQLGFMFVALGLGAYTVALFHVTTHAFFKALLFLGSGSVIHANHHEQDITKMGGLKKYMPITHLVFLIGTLAISGFPLLSGFFSKDEIFAATFGHGYLVFGLMVLAAAMTTTYMFRMYFLVFHGSFRGESHTEKHLHESGALMTLPLIVLAILSVVGGALNLPSFIAGQNAHWMDHFLDETTLGLSILEPHHLSDDSAIGIMIGTTILTLLIMFWTYSVYSKSTYPISKEQQFRGWAKWSNNKLFVDELYNVLFVKPIEFISAKLLLMVENNLLYDSILRATSGIQTGGNQIRKIQTGLLSNYLYFMILGVVLFLGYSLYYFKFWSY
ncbi:MAG: NADH-quinone oxidoreductase subunit L, partial [Bacteroidetes bacterium]|nr:NADH-quinone oxidoreductase subunit L [Bacteroidota bacterium]